MATGTDATSPSTQFTPSPKTRTALIVGSTGIVGGNLAAHLVDQGWRVYGLARKPATVGGIIPIAADLRDETSVRSALAGVDPTHVFLSIWLRQSTEAENVRVNGAMTRNLFAALEAKTLTHAALVTGTKQYLGPFESYGQTAAETPFREDTPRLPGENFYYTQEDILFAAAERGGFSWSVHRPHSIVGYALGNAMNMGVTLAVYATICRETGQPFVFPGSHLQWNALTDVTDARLLAHHLEWTALSPQTRNQAFNVVNGDVFRWRWLWPQIASYFGIEPAGPPDPIQPLAAKFSDAASVWQSIADKYALAERDVNKLVSWWHTDSDLGRQLECVNDMTKSRLLGFTLYQETRASFFDLFDRLRREKIIPA
jgi:nucleoside-diphosphate-sugar epimerase